MLIAVDPTDPRPVYQQIAAAIKEQVRQGTLGVGAELPSVRELAGILGINLHTVRHAYQILQMQGVLHLRLGSRARVAALRTVPPARHEIEQQVIRRLKELVSDAYHLGLTSDQFQSLVDEVVRGDAIEKE